MMYGRFALILMPPSREEPASSSDLGATDSHSTVVATIGQVKM
jgi:hypothetical protein